MPSNLPISMGFFALLLRLPVAGSGSGSCATALPAFSFRSPPAAHCLPRVPTCLTQAWNASHPDEIPKVVHHSSICNVHVYEVHSDLLCLDDRADASNI